MRRWGLITAALVLSMCLPAGASAAVDLSRTDYTTGSLPYDPEIADLDGQNGLDVVLGNRSGNGAIQVFLNEGDGTFGEPTTLPVTCSFGGTPQVELDAANLSDSFVDIITGCQVGFRGNGDGTFAAAYNSGSFAREIFMDLGDVNTTTASIPDLVTSCGSGSNQQLLAYGSGQTDGSYPVNCIQDPQTLQFQPIEREVEIYNLGNDNYTDIVTFNAGRTQIIGNEYNTDLYPQTGYKAFGSSRETNGTNGVAIEPDDLDGDGDADWTAAMAGPPEKLSVFEQTGNGFPQGQSGELTDTIGNVNDLEIADVDGDNSPDAVTASTTGQVGVQIGDGDATFQAPQVFSGPNTTGSANNLATDDLNGDGSDDIVLTSLATGQMTVFLASSSGDAEAPLATIGNIKVSKRKAKVTFTGEDNADPPSALEFACQIDAKPVKPCSSPKTYKRLDVGRHKVRVRAVDTANNFGEFDKKGFKIKK